MALPSMRARYLAIALPFVLTLVILAWVAEVRVNSAINSQLANSSARQQARQTLRVIMYDLWNVGNAFHEYMLAPDINNHSVAQQLSQSLAHTTELGKLTLAKQQPNFQAGLLTLQKDLQLLSMELKKVMALRVNAEELYPALQIMVDKLLPAYNDFYTSSTLAMQESEKLDGSAGQRQVYKQFSEARHTWILMVGAFRTYVSYRFGIFPGDPQNGMDEQASAISLYKERLSEQLSALKVLQQKGRLSATQRLRLHELEILHNNWHQNYNKVATIYASENWRTDLPILRDRIQPLFAAVRTDARNLDKQIELYSTQDMRTLALTAGGLSQTLWIFVLTAILVTITVFLVIEYSLRRPISRVTAALRSEARNLQGKPLPPTYTVETNELVMAFTDMREHVHTRQQRLEIILDNAAEGILTFDRSGNIESINKAAEKLFGYDETEVLTKCVCLLIPAAFCDTRSAGKLPLFVVEKVTAMMGRESEVAGKHKDGTRLPLAIKVSRIVLQGRELYTMLVADISERIALLTNLKTLAEHDGLTQLYNRSYFMQELEHIVHRNARDRQGYALLYLDLDNFKYVNDTLGHLAGDRLLIEVAQVLKKRVRTSDLVARLGGDEFTVLLYNISPAQVLPVAESFREALSDYVFRHEGLVVDIGCSIGAATLSNDAISGEQILSQADIACNLAKRAGRNRVHIFEAQDSSNVTTMSMDMGWSRRIKDAITHNRFVLVFQPLVNTGTREIEHYEVLVRLRDDAGGLILPNGFLPSAERFGLATEIDKWVITHTIETLAKVRQYAPHIRFAVNLSGATLSEPGIANFIQAQLSEAELDPASLMFEITETLAIADMSRAESLISRLKSLGCLIALDDFGSGLSSFAYLKDLQVDIVKIDGRFVKNLSHNQVDFAIVKSMNEIAHALGKKTIAEWVEDEATFQVLKTMGVDSAQGFHLGRPAEMSEEFQSAGESILPVVSSRALNSTGA